MGRAQESKDTCAPVCASSCAPSCLNSGLNNEQEPVRQKSAPVSQALEFGALFSIDFSRQQELSISLKRTTTVLMALSHRDGVTLVLLVGISTVIGNAVGSSSSSFASAPTRLHVKDGFLLSGSTTTWVGTNTSSLMSLFPLFAPAANVSTLGSQINGSVLRYLQLEGTYTADVTFSLPSLMVLDMRSGAVLNAPEVSPPSVLVLASGEYSAILGGHFDCSTAKNITQKEFTGISADGTGITIRGATVTGCGIGNGYESGNIRVRGHGSEVSGCEVSYGGRGIWTETITSSVIHGNHAHHTAVGIDVDGTSGPHVSVYNNVVEHSTGYGLWFGAPSTAAVLHLLLVSLLLQLLSSLLLLFMCCVYPNFFRLQRKALKASLHLTTPSATIRSASTCITMVLKTAHCRS